MDRHCHNGSRQEQGSCKNAKLRVQARQVPRGVTGLRNMCGGMVDACQACCASAYYLEISGKGPGVPPTNLAKVSATHPALKPEHMNKQAWQSSSKISTKQTIS